MSLSANKSFSWSTVRSEAREARRLDNRSDKAPCGERPGRNSAWQQHKARVQESLKVLLDGKEDFVLNEITRAEVLREIFQFMENLPMQCRKIVLMSFIAGLSNQQIANRLQLSVHTVRNQKIRGIYLMRQKAKDCW